MLRLDLFGTFKLTDSGGAEIQLKSSKAKALLAYLAVPPGQPRSREEIMALLWSDRAEPQGRASLRQVLSGIRKALGEGNSDALIVEHDSIALDPDRITVTENTGDTFLSGLHINDPAFEEWLRDERLAAESETNGSRTPPRSAQPEKPSIAVLPFANLSMDPEQEYFSDGITEDIITELNRFQSLFVIARNSSFAFRGKDVDPADTAEKLGVQFLVLGSVRKAGDRIRISVQLVDAATARHLWSERYDREMADVFALQDEIAATVATMVSGHVDIATRIKSERKHPKDINAYDLVCRSDWLGYTDYTTTEQERLLEQAIALDPTYAVAHARLATYQAYSVFYLALNSSEIAPIVKKHGGLAAHLAPGDAMVHAPLAEGYALVGEHDLAAHHLERTLSINPNAFQSMAHSAEVIALLGDHAAALKMIREAMLRDPYSSMSFRENMFDICYLAGQYDVALQQFVGWPNPPIHMELAKSAALAQLGRISEARDVVLEFESRRPEDWDIDVVLRNYRRMCALPEDGERWLEGFSKAGLGI